MKIFIMGNGRSGTHMVADLIHSSGRYEYNGEENPMFSLSCEINILGKKERIPELLALYESKENYIDKCHPNLWIAETLISRFPNDKFICVHRSMHGTVQSMMKHEGCMSWFKVAPVPNPFLGIDNNAEMSPESLCRNRWLAHHWRVIDLRRSGKDIFFFNYDNRVTDALRLEKYLNIKINHSLIR